MINPVIKIFFLLVFFLFNILALSAQDSIPTKQRKNIITYNYSYSIATVWNQSFAYERSLNKKVSIHVMMAVGIRAFLSDEFYENQDACFRITPELRYYFSKKSSRPLMAGFYSGVFLYYQYQKISNSNYHGYDYVNNVSIYMNNAEWKYSYMGGGISIGYQLHALQSKRLIFDFNTGLQYSNITYKTDTNDKGNANYNFTYSRFLSEYNNSFVNNRYSAIDPRIWLSIGYSF